MIFFVKFKFLLAEMQINNHKEIWNVRFHRQIGFLPHTHTHKKLRERYKNNQILNLHSISISGILTTHFGDDLLEKSLFWVWRNRSPSKILHGEQRDLVELILIMNVIATLVLWNGYGKFL